MENIQDFPHEIRRFAFTTLAGGVRAKLFETLIQSKLLDIYRQKNEYSEDEIIEQLKSHPLRTRKWLHLLSVEYLLKKTTRENIIYYSLSPLCQKFLAEKGKPIWLECVDMIESLQRFAEENFHDVLNGSAIKFTVNWPPQSYQDTELLEEWMRNTAFPPYEALIKHFDFTKVSTVLDVGGGDGTIACNLAKRFPHLKIAVFNLPHAATLATHNIQKQDLTDRVKVIAGDFLKDNELPKDFDLMIFSRVLWDWSHETSAMLLRKAYAALQTGGLIAITEAFLEENRDCSLVLEYRYLFWDNFEAAVFKSGKEYEELLANVGFKIASFHRGRTSNVFSVLIGQKS